MTGDHIAGQRKARGRSEYSERPRAAFRFFRKAMKFYVHSLNLLKIAVQTREVML